MKINEFIKSMLQIKMNEMSILFGNAKKAFPQVDAIVCFASFDTRKDLEKEIEAMKKIAFFSKSLLEDEVSKHIIFVGGKIVQKGQKEWEIMHDSVFSKTCLNKSASFSLGETIKEKGGKVARVIKNFRFKSIVVITYDKNSVRAFRRRIDNENSIKVFVSIIK